LFQGRYGKGNGQEYLEHFMVEFRRPGLLSDWRLYTDKTGNQVSIQAAMQRYLLFQQPLSE
jgi:hypothetical protein